MRKYLKVLLNKSFLTYLNKLLVTLIMFAFLSKIYRTKIFPKIKNLRGSVWLSRFFANLATLSLKRYPYPPYTILDFKWDVLIILDACRYDLFCKYLGYECDYIISVGSDTQEWFKNTFVRKSCKDIIYISGNPFISEYYVKKLLRSNPFFRIEPVWEYGWNNKIGTTMPKEVTRACMRMLLQHPSKKFIVHYLQPHHPFIKLNFYGMPKEVRYGKQKFTKDVWYYFEHGLISKDRVLKAYFHNLKWVMKEVKKLGHFLKSLKKKVIITSDHGNHLGENHLYGHIPGLRTEELVKVPWISIEEIL